MNITFDEQADALYIQFQPSKRVKKTRRLRDGVLVDVDQAGRIFGIEILDVSHRIARRGLARVNTNLPLHA